MKNVLIFCFCLFIVQSAVGFINEPLDTDFCQKGYGTPWVGACVCENPILYTGRYCDIHTTNFCQSNQECAQDSFCLQAEENGACAPIKTQGPVIIDNGSFVMSDMLLNYQSAKRFCAQYKQGYRQASRADFMCTGIGPACLDAKQIIALQDNFGTRGFFWLDSKDETNAYYADMNDGTVYETSKQNFKTIQALCIKKEQ